MLWATHGSRNSMPTSESIQSSLSTRATPARGWAGHAECFAEGGEIGGSHDDCRLRPTLPLDSPSGVCLTCESPLPNSPPAGPAADFRLPPEPIAYGQSPFRLVWRAAAGSFERDSRFGTRGRGSAG